MKRQPIDLATRERLIQTARHMLQLFDVYDDQPELRVVRMENILKILSAVREQDEWDLAFRMAERMEK